MNALRISPLFAALAAIPALAAAAVETPRIHHVEMLEPQPWKSDDAVIWYDAWDKPSSQYFEQKGPLTDKEAFGGSGQSLEVFYPKGKGGGGSANRKLAIGDSPVGGGKAVKKGNKFDTVYWRMYVKHQRGWTGGGPAKMSRVMIMNASNWSQAMISHVWGGGDSLTLDPVRAARGTGCTTSKYNDWGGLKWICNSPGSQFKIHATSEAGRWVCVEAQAKLNTPGKSDGYNCLWIDGIKQTERKNIDFRSSYTKYGINCVFIESYWNKGSPVDQRRYYDDLVVSTKYIGPARTPLNPVLVKTAYAGGGEQKAWEVEVAVRSDGGDLTVNSSRNVGGRNPVVGEDIQGERVWKSKPVAGTGLKVTVDAASGAFSGSRAAKGCLAPDKLYFCRVRQQSAGGGWSEWSAWHQGFMTGKLAEPEGGATPAGGALFVPDGATQTGGARSGGDPLAKYATRLEMPRALASSHKYGEALKIMRRSFEGVEGEAKKSADRIIAGYEAGEVMRAAIIKEGARKRPRIDVDFAGKPARARLVSADESGIKADIRGMEAPIPWGKITPERFYGIARRIVSDHKLLAAYCDASGLKDAASGERVKAARR